MESKAQDNCSSAFTMAGDPGEGAKGTSASNNEAYRSSGWVYVLTSVCAVVAIKVCSDDCLVHVLVNGTVAQHC